MPTVGWVLLEERQGRLRAEALKPILQAHGIGFDRLRAFKHARVPIELPNGELLLPDEYIEPSTHRKLVLLSDTSDASAALPHARDADLVVHEATNACTS